MIDSHGWIEYFSEGPLSSKYARYIENANASECITPSIVIYEVYKKIKSIRGEDAALRAVAHIIEHTEIIPIDKNTALNAAEISIITKLGMADAMIKAVAEEKGAKVVTGDEHFKDFEGAVFIQ